MLARLIGLLLLLPSAASSQELTACRVEHVTASTDGATLEGVSVRFSADRTAEMLLTRASGRSRATDLDRVAPGVSARMVVYRHPSGVAGATFTRVAVARDEVVIENWTSTDGAAQTWRSTVRLRCP